MLHVYLYLLHHFFNQCFTFTLFYKFSHVFFLELVQVYGYAVKNYLNIELFADLNVHYSYQACPYIFAIMFLRIALHSALCVCTRITTNLFITSLKNGPIVYKKFLCLFSVRLPANQVLVTALTKAVRGVCEGALIKLLFHFFLA